MNTKEKLLEAAERCLLEKGSHAASVKAIALMAGVNHGLVHHYFGSKEGLFIELLQQHCVTETSTQDLSFSSNQEFVSYLVDTVVSNSRILTELRSLSFHMPELHKALIIVSSDMRKKLMNILQINEEKAMVLQAVVAGLGFQTNLDPSIDIENYLIKTVGILLKNHDLTYFDILNSNRFIS